MDNQTALYYDIPANHSYSIYLRSKEGLQVNRDKAKPPKMGSDLLKGNGHYEG